MQTTTPREEAHFHHAQHTTKELATPSEANFCSAHKTAHFYPTTSEAHFFHSARKNERRRLHTSRHTSSTRHKTAQFCFISEAQILSRPKSRGTPQLVTRRHSKQDGSTLLLQERGTTLQLDTTSEARRAHFFFTSEAHFNSTQEGTLLLHKRAIEAQFLSVYNNEEAHFFHSAAAAADDESKSSFMRRWRTSTTAVKSANRALQVGSGSISSVNNANSNTAGHDNHTQFPQDKEFSDPFEAFRLLLDGTRSLQKQFFPVSPHAGNTSSGGNYVNILSFTTNSTSRTGSGMQTRRVGDMDDQRMSAYSQGTRDREDSQDSDGDTASYSGSSVTVASSSSVGGSNTNKPTNRNCSGLTESLRMELAATLSLNSSVRTRNIETVDQAFAFACANTLDRLLHALERETYAYIAKVYKVFETSTDYATMVATKRANHAPQIASYIERLEFLSDRVRHEKQVHWTDPQSAGKMYMFYEQAGSVEAEDAVEGDSSDSDGGGTGDVTYLASGGGGLNSLLAVGNKDTTNMRGVLAAKIANIHGVNPATTSLRKDSRFNTSSSGWQFSQAESFMIRKEVPGEEQQVRNHASNAFNPDIVAVGLEFYVPESEPISPANISAVSTHMRVWVGGSNYKPKVPKESLASDGSGKSRAPPNTPSDPRNRKEGVDSPAAGAGRTGGGGLANASGSTLTGGTWNLGGQLTTATAGFIDRLATGTSVTISGAGHGFFNTSGNAFSTLSALDAGASLSLLNGATLTSTGTLALNGNLSLSSGSTLTLGGLGAITQPLNLTGATLTTGSLPLAGSALSFSGPLTLAGTLNYSGTAVTGLAAGTAFNVGSGGTFLRNGACGWATLVDVSGTLDLTGGTVRTDAALTLADNANAVINLGPGGERLPAVMLGIDVLEADGFAAVKGKRIGLLTHPAGVNRNGLSTVEVLRRAPGVKLVALYAGEHGIYGDLPAEKKYPDQVDPRTGIMVYSLYSGVAYKGKSFKASPAQLKNIDALVVDLQDIGTRSYTFTSAMKLAVEACFENGKEVIILDRPNPLGGLKVDGPPLDAQWMSYVGAFRVPYVHGLTMGELARMVRESHAPGGIDVTDAQRAAGKLTVNRALGDGDGARARSLAALKRARDKERRIHMSGQSRDAQPKQVRDVVVPEVITIQELANRMAEK
eukprot:gene22904-29081_t